MSNQAFTYLICYSDWTKYGSYLGIHPEREKSESIKASLMVSMLLASLNEGSSLSESVTRVYEKSKNGIKKSFDY